MRKFIKTFESDSWSNKAEAEMRKSGEEIMKKARERESKSRGCDCKDCNCKDCKIENCNCGCCVQTNEKSTSKSQQRLMGQAYAYKTGQLKTKDIKQEYADEIKKLAKGMTEDQLKDFAKTKHKGLPQKVKENKIMGFESFNESFFSPSKKYVITYNIRNYEATEEEWNKGKYSRDWISNNYEYIINAKSEDDAKDKFVTLWNKKVDSFEPRPELNIISVNIITSKTNMDRNRISTESELKFY